MPITRSLAVVKSKRRPCALDDAKKEGEGDLEPRMRQMRGLPAATHAETSEARNTTTIRPPMEVMEGIRIDDRRDASCGPDHTAQDAKREFFYGFGSRAE